MGAEMREQLAAILEQCRLLVLQHAPADVLKEAIPFGIVCLIVGIVLSVLGAKLARFALTCGFALLGGYLGSVFGRETGFPMPVCGIVAALMIGVVGYHTFRLWVGLAAAAVLSAVVMGTFSYRHVVPHVVEYQQSISNVAAAEPGTFSVPSLDQQQAYRDRTPQQWAQELWTFVSAKDVRIERQGKALGLAALVTGLCLGVVAVRWALILSASLVGTALVTTALGTLVTHSFPGSYQSFEQHPGLVGVGVGSFLVTSLVVQTLVTRKAPSEKKED